MLGCAENALCLRENLEEGHLGGYAGDVCKAGTIGVFTPQAMTFPIGALQQRNLTVGSRSNRSPKRIEEE